MGNDTLDVFVSCARTDWRHAADIVAGLKARGFTFFFNRRDLPPGMPWVRELEKALNAAKATIILIGPHGLGNTQQYERDVAIYRQTRDPSFSIIPVILPDAEIDRPYNFLQVEAAFGFLWQFQFALIAQGVLLRLVRGPWSGKTRFAFTGSVIQITRQMNAC
jgi:hypothetical protein